MVRGWPPARYHDRAMLSPLLGTSQDNGKDRTMYGSETDQARRGRWAVVEYADGELARIVGLCRELEDAVTFAAHLAGTMPRTDGTITYTYGVGHADRLEMVA